MLVKLCSSSTVANRSPAEPDSVRAAAAKSRTVSLTAFPLPRRFAAPVSSSSDSAPSEFAPSGPSAETSVSRLAYSSSSSTGVAVRDVGITAPSAISGRPRAVSVSCTYRSETTLGAITTALVSPATLTSRSRVNTTSTRSPRGVTDSTAPTRTPSTCTSEPG